MMQSIAEIMEKVLQEEKKLFGKLRNSPNSGIKLFSPNFEFRLFITDSHCLICSGAV